MDPNELIKAVPEIIGGAAKVAAGTIPFTGIVKRMLGPAADEVAEMWRDQVRVYRYGRQLKLLEKAERMATDAGYTPQAVPPKILFPLLEGASFEYNEDLHDMWAALLANAASPEVQHDSIRPGFIATLRQLSQDEAALLDWVYRHVAKEMPGNDFYEPIHESELLQAYVTLGFGPIESDSHRARESASASNWRFGSCLNSLEAAQLIRTRFDVINVGRVNFYYSLTYLGFQFVSACRPPAPKK
jgi:hypothetical protein